MTETVDLQDIIPHRPPMLLIDTFNYCRDHEVSCSVTVRDDALLVVDGKVPALVALEYFAQTVASLYGYMRRHQTGGFEMGMLLGSREITLETDYFHVGDVLHITGVEAFSAPPISQFRCELRRAGDPAVLARGSISVFASGAPPQ
ncbi:MAG: hypothetical protein JNL82_00145 [Myxococcales bacterium]|jgi:predicted hotdog family 3-hydroxylacyl-ACP dehydratase|nr:hypothetical protein [Myxococcales bacterium]